MPPQAHGVSCGGDRAATPAPVSPTRIQILGEKIQIHYLKVAWAWLGLWALLTALIGFAAGWPSAWVLATVFASGIIVWECLLRTILRAAYGREYRYSFLNHILTDHPTYGYCLRPSTHSREIEFPIFDRCAFPPRTPRILDPAGNRNARVDLNINSLGYRGPEFEPDKKKAKLRIFCCGGSTTFCPCSSDAQAWPSVLEARLRSEGFDVEVINAGVLGWHSYLDRLRFQKEISRQMADVVLIHEGWNEEFQFSSLSLGRHWRPAMTRNAREAYNLYCAPNRFYSSTALLGVYLFIQHTLKALVFSRNMDFRNPRRWHTLLRNEYIIAWIDNLLAMADTAVSGGIMLYTLDLPGLTSLSDTGEERRAFIQNTRLTPLYADYQAISRFRIQQVLAAMEPVIARINLGPSFDPYRGKDRLDLFYDEIHLTAAGNAILGESLASMLMNDRSFLDRHRDGGRGTNVRLECGKPEALRRKATEMPPFITRFIEERVEMLERASGGSRKRGDREVPPDRYTTW